MKSELLYFSDHSQEWHLLCKIRVGSWCVHLVLNLCASSKTCVLLLHNQVFDWNSGAQPQTPIYTEHRARSGPRLSLGDAHLQYKSNSHRPKPGPKEARNKMDIDIKETEFWPTRWMPTI